MKSRSPTASQSAAGKFRRTPTVPFCDLRKEPIVVHKVKAVIAKEKNAPVTLETILVPDPGPGEALVDILTCGVCHTDLHYQQGGISDDFPFLLGHEATGVVSAVGPDVTEVAPGDRVILNWRAVCGQCRACAKGQPQYCFNTHNATQKMTLEDGTELSPALGIGAFAEKTSWPRANAPRLMIQWIPPQWACWDAV